MSPFLGLSLKRGPARRPFIADRELVVSTTEPVSEPIEDWTTIISVVSPIGNEIAQVAPPVRAIPQEIAEVVTRPRPVHDQVTQIGAPLHPVPQEIAQVIACRQPIQE